MAVEIKQLYLSSERLKVVVRKMAIILTGLAILQSLRLTITGGVYAVSRFKLHPGQTGLFIKLTLNTTEIFCVLGILTTTIYSMIRGRVGQCCRRFDKYVSIVTSWLNVVAYIFIFFAYYTGGAKGHVTLYYWSLVVASLFYGMHQSMVLNMITKEVAYYFVGYPLSGLIILVYHVAFRYFFNLFNKKYIEFYLVIFQIEIGIALWLMASVFWTWAFWSYEPPDPSLRNETGDEEGGRTTARPRAMTKSFSERLKQAASPFFMNIFGLAFIFVFYPAIAPYELVDADLGYKIDLVVLLISITVACGIAVAVYFDVGPNRKWIGIYKIYHCTWLLFIPYYGSMILLFLILHYPYNQVSYYIRSNANWVALLTLVLKAMDDIIRAISTNGVSMQGDSEDGDMACLANCIAQVLFNIFSFIGLGYIRLYRAYDKDRSSWPTKGLCWAAAIWFWFRKSCAEGWDSLLQSLTLNIRGYFEVEDAESIWSL